MRNNLFLCGILLLCTSGVFAQVKSPPSVYTHTTVFCDGYAYMQSSMGSEWAIFNENWEPCSHFLSYLPAHTGEQFSEGVIAVYKETEGVRAYGYLFPNGSPALPFVFTSAEAFHNGRAKVTYKGKPALVDHEGHITFSSTAGGNADAFAISDLDARLVAEGFYTYPSDTCYTIITEGRFPFTYFEDVMADGIKIRIAYTAYSESEEMITEVISLAYTDSLGVLHGFSKENTEHKKGERSIIITNNNSSRRLWLWGAEALASASSYYEHQHTLIGGK